MITSFSFPFRFDFLALDLREASAIIDDGVPGGKKGVSIQDATATRALKVCELVECCK
jgi:hypothetical protein